jgi:small ligand-binding sensory domain FIST
VVATKRENDTVRDELVKKRKKAQVHQGEKMKKAYANSLQQSAENVTQASVLTVFVDQQVASHAHRVLVIVVERKSTGAIIACSEAGIITNGLGKKVWWIPSDGYKQISNDEDIMALSPYLLKVQQDIMVGSFDQKKP